MSAYRKFDLAFVRKEDIEKIISGVIDATILSQNGFPAKRKCGHVVVLGVSILEDINKKYPNNFFKQNTVLFEKSFGKNTDDWNHNFDEIARCKALQLADASNQSLNMNSVSHMLFESDTPFWGGHKEGDIVVAFSGIQPYFDQMISKMVVAGIVAMAEHNKQEWLIKNPGKDFI